MKEVSSINIVCPGSWNKKIFTPAWVGSHLFQLDKDEIQAAFSPNELELGYFHNNVILYPKDEVVEIKLENITEESKKFSGVLLNRILTLLPQTPIRAIGINIRYRFKKEENNAIIRKLNQIKGGIDEFLISQVKFSKSYKRYQLNIISDIRENEYFVNFNFHHTNQHYPEGFELNNGIIFDLIEKTKEIINYE